MCMCFQHMTLRLWLLQKTLLQAIWVQAGVVKKVCLAFSLVLISFSKNLVYSACAEFQFFNQILFFLMLLNLLVSVDILVIKIITPNLADVWQIIFSLNLLTFYHLKGLVFEKRFEKKSLPTKILSSFALLAQPHQNIANRSD